MAPPHRLIAGLVLLVLIVPGAETAPGAGCVAAAEPVRELVDGVLHVRNGAAPRDGRRSVALREVWRAGGEDRELFFGLVPRVETDRAGNVYVLDAQLCRVHVFSPDGELLRTLFREGDGPGEARGPRDMFLLADGRVGLVLEAEGAVVLVENDGDPAGRFTLGGARGGIFALTAGTGAGDQVVLSGTAIRPGRVREVRLRRNFLSRFDLDGARTARYAETRTQRDFRDFRFGEREDMPVFAWCFDARADGTVFATLDRDRYAVTVFGPDGGPVMVVERAYAPLARSDAERRAFHAMIETTMENLPIPCAVTVEERHAAVAYLLRGLQVRDDGSLWVLSGRGARPAEPGVMAVFDVFDRGGVFVEQVALRAPHAGSRVGIVLSGPDHVLVIRGYLESLATQFGNGATWDADEGDWEAPEVICYEMAPAR